MDKKFILIWNDNTTTPIEGTDVWDAYKKSKLTVWMLSFLREWKEEEKIENK